jgi:beta-glucosidase
LPLKKSGTIAVIGPLADAKKIWLELGVSLNMDKSISIAGIKVAGNGTNVLYAKGSNLDYDAGFEEKRQCLEKPCIVMIELLQN